MTYTLELNLIGADKVGNSLASLQTAVKNLSSSGGSNGGSGGIFSTGSNSPSSMMIADLSKAKVYSKDIATNLAQGFAPWRKSAIELFSGMNPATRAKMFAANPQLAAEWNAMMTPQRVFKGLREVGGADLAKVHSMGSFEQNIASPSILQKLSSIPMFAKYLTIVGATVLALDVLKKAITAVAQEIKSAFQFAHTLYGSSLAQGLSLQFNAKRSLTASTLGVPETEVMRFQQSSYVMGRLGDAVKEISKSAPDLAYIGVQWRILKIDLLGVASSIADKLTPALDGLILVLDAFVKIVADLGKAMGAILKNSLSAKIIGGAIGSELASSGILNLLNIGMNDMAQHAKQFQNPLTLMKQLPASQWEHMGLNLGLGGGNTTNDLIRKSNQYLSTLPMIAHALGAGVARANQFGFSAQVNNP